MKWLGLTLFLLFNYISAEPIPIVLWHGMGDTCCLAYSLGLFKSFLEKQIPGVYVLSLRIGNSTVEDFENGYFMCPNKQVEYVCEELAKDPKLNNGFNAIGFSQGSQFLRAVVQRCGHKLGPIKNLITLGGQHQGVYGLPHCFALQHESCDYVRKLLNYAAYYSWVQKSLVQATYWHDPLDEATYKKSSEFLADINNEMKINQTYIDNLNNLEHFVMVKFDGDSIVQPKETEWFGFYAPGQAKELLTLQQSAIYQQIMQNCVGIKYIDVKSTEADSLFDESLELSSTSIKPKDNRRFWIVNSNVKLRSQPKDVAITEEEKDERLKSKISSLVDQTIYDTERKISMVQNMKEKHRDKAPYRVGFLLSMIKKSKEVLSELFNVAVKHKDDWKALEQLKIFELIVHTNVDTTNLVRQLVEIHVEHLNSSSNKFNSRRVVLIRK